MHSFNLDGGAFTLNDHDPASDAFHPIHRTPEFPSRDPFSVQDSDNKLTPKRGRRKNPRLPQFQRYCESEARLETIQTVSASRVQDLCSARVSLALGAKGAGGQEWDS